MSRNRFYAVSECLHFQNNKLDPPAKDRLWKIRPFYDYITGRFTDVYIPEQQVLIDEGLLLWKGRLVFKQYIPKKRARFGLKSYQPAESQTGYVWKVRLYTGQDREAASKGGHGVGYYVVMDLRVTCPVMAIH